MATNSGGVTPRQRLVGDRVRERRQNRGLSQEAMALEAGLHRSYIAQLEGGRRNPSLDTLAKVAVALRCDLADLVRGAQNESGR